MKDITLRSAKEPPKPKMYLLLRYLVSQFDRLTTKDKIRLMRSDNELFDFIYTEIEYIGYDPFEEHPPMHELSFNAFKEIMRRWRSKELDSYT